VDENFIPFYGLKLIAGRNFERDERKRSIIISRFAAERLGFHEPDEAIGSLVEEGLEDERQTVEIIGVIEDYRVTPFLMEEGSTESVTGRGQCLSYLNSVFAGTVPQRISLKAEGENALDLIAGIESLFKQEFPDNLFNWYFLDDNVNKHYGDQKIARNQLTFFTILAVGVSCLGLLGMIYNKAAEKFKEISVRRILGAMHRHVLSLLLRSTIVQLGTALIIGLPIAWKFSNQYLEKYTDRIEIQWWHFALPVLILTVIMFLTIASVLWKAARSNPVEALKHE
jgi:putative ABC transport system permease protein